MIPPPRSATRWIIGGFLAVTIGVVLIVIGLASYKELMKEPTRALITVAPGLIMLANGCYWIRVGRGQTDRTGTA